MTSQKVEERGIDGGSVVRPGGWTPRFVLMMVVLILPSELSFLAFAYPLNAAVQIGQTFDTTQTAWLQTIYALTAAVSSALIGKLADQHGKRRVLMVILALVLVGSAIGTFAPNFELILLARVVQAPALTLAFLLPSLARDIFPTRTVPLAVSLASGGAGLLSIGTSLIVGVVIVNLGYQATFWIPGVVAAALLLIVPLILPESDVRTKDRRLDVVGALLLGVGVGGVLLAVSLSSTLTWASPITLGSLVLGLILLAAWIAQALRTTEPLLDVREISHLPLAVTLILAAIGINAGSFFYVVMPLVTQSSGAGWGLAIGTEGQALVASLFSLGAFLGGVLAGVLLSRVAAPLVGAGAMALLIVSYGMAALGLQSTLLFSLAATLTGLGSSVAAATVYNLVIVVVRPERQATNASAATLTGNMFSAVFPVAIFAVMSTMLAPGADGVVGYSSTAVVVAMVTSAGLAVVGLIFTLALHRRTRGSGLLIGGRHS